MSIFKPRFTKGAALALIVATQAIACVPAYAQSGYAYSRTKMFPQTDGGMIYTDIDDDGQIVVDEFDSDGKLVEHTIVKVPGYEPEGDDDDDKGGFIDDGTCPPNFVC